MSAVFPRAVVWDESATCHVSIIVDRGEQTITYMCAECEVVDVYPLSYLENLKALLRKRNDLQVVAWVERNG